MSLRSTLRKAAGLLVELPPEPEEEVPILSPDEIDSMQHRQAASEVKKVVETLQAGPPTAHAKTVEQIVRDAPGPNLDQVQVAEPAPSILNPDGTVNFPALYQSASLPPAPFSVEQVLAMVDDMPAEFSIEMKRQAVKAAIQAMGKSLGATPENVVADASRKLAALASYAEHVNKQAGDFITKTEMDILELERQIEERRAAIASAQEKQQRITALCTAESDRLDDILEILSLDVPPSRLAPQA
jgi:hypothetical protein